MISQTDGMRRLLGFADLSACGEVSLLVSAKTNAVWPRTTTPNGSTTFAGDQDSLAETQVETPNCSTVSGRERAAQLAAAIGTTLYEPGPMRL